MTQGTGTASQLDSTAANSVRGEGVLYVYGVVPADFAARQRTTGLDDSEVSLERAANDAPRVAALVSVLDAAEYAPEPLEARMADVSWLGPRAAAHDRVLTWASDRGPVVPFPMFSVFSGTAALQRMLRERGDELARALDRISTSREYGVAVYRVDAELLAAITELSPRLAELERAANAASPGQRYLLERKLATSKREELRAVSRSVAEALWSELCRHAVEVRRLPVAQVGASEAAAATRGTMVLNAAFLVRPDALDAFQRALTVFARTHEARGFRLHFTGPWPPYHFVGSDASANADADEAHRGG